MATTKPPIKLLFFSPYFYPYISGLTQYPYNLFTKSNLPLEATCLTFPHKKDLSQKESIGTMTNIIRMPFLFRLSKGFISPQSLLFFWNETRKNNIVMINLPSFEGVFLALFAFIQRKPIISLLHCEVLLPFSLPNLITNFILNCGVFFQLLLSKKIIVYTEDYYKNKRMYRIFKNKMEVLLPPIHSSPSDAHYLNELAGLKKKYPYALGFCGRIAAEKGIEVLIESVSERKDTILFFAGPTGKDVVGEEKYFEKIKNLLDEKKVAHIFLGSLSTGRLSSFYKSIDILLLPSLNKTEAFGMVQVEAMLQGTPVIASDLPGVRVPIQLSKMGMVVSPSDVSGLKNAITKILLNKSQYTNPHLVHTVSALFDSQKTYDSINAVIHNLTAKIV